MTRRTPYSIALGVGVALMVLQPLLAQVDERDDPSIAIWRSPSFRKAFLAQYGAATEIEPEITAMDYEILEQVGELMAQKGGLAKARVLLLKSMATDSSAVLDFTLGQIYFEMKKPEYAAKWYSSAIRKHSAFMRAYKSLGMLYVRGGEYDKALTPLTRAIELGGGDGLTLGLLGYGYMMTEQYLSAESAYRQAVMLQPQTLDWKLGLARCLFRQAKYPEASALCSELVRAEPDKPDFWLLQANAYLGMKQPLKAAENYEYVDLRGQSTVESLNTLGDIYVNEKVMDLAADAYARAMRMDTEGRAIGRFIQNAEALGARAAYDQAQALVEVLKQQFGEDIATEQRKRILKLEARIAAAQGRAAEAQAALLEQIVKLDPLDGEALILLGQHYAKVDDLARAALYFERAAAMEAFEADAKLRHGQSLVRAGRYDEALPLLKRANVMNPREDLSRYIEQVERVARTRR